MTRTHTYAELEVPPVVFAAVKALLLRADYGHAIREAEGPGDKALIDMHGIALSRQGGDKPGLGAIEIGTILSHSTGRGRIEIQLGAEVAQWDVADAKKVSAMLTEAIEAAISDELIFTFLRDRVHLSPEKAAALLIDFRELRQGSKETVNPS